MEIKLYQVDAFARKPFEGNPAAVCPLDAPISAETMQSIAAENNLSETAFLLKEGDGYNLRWFTPTVEIDLCGHATLASAHILYEEGMLSPDQKAVFHTRSGELTVLKKGPLLEMTFPAIPTEAVALPEQMREALGVTPRYAGLSSIDYLVEIDDPAELARLHPDFNGLAPFTPVIVTARGAAGSGYDFVSRMFAPSVGINEDPVTGSAHCQLAPYWASRLHKNEFRAYQCSRRGGELDVVLAGDRVRLTGKAITVLRGTFYFGEK